MKPLKNSVFQKLGLFSLLSLMLASAQASDEFLRIPGSLQGFNFNEYSNCRALIKQCPINGAVPNKNCVNKILDEHKSCNQFKQLANELNVPAFQIQLEKAGMFILVREIHPADGQDLYSILTPNGRIVKTYIDPRKLDNKIDQQFKDKDFFIVNWRAPIYKLNPDGTQSITADLRIHNTCLTCSVLGWSINKINFDKDGQFQNIELLKFREEKSARHK